MQRTPQDNRRSEGGTGAFGPILPLQGPADVDRWLDARRHLVAPGVAQRARLVARLLAGGMISGQELAAELGVSRAAVHKHVETLRGLGVELHSVPGSGYRLSGSLDVVAPEALLPFLAGSSTGLGVPLLYETSVESTNAVAREAARRGSPHGTLVMTDYQHAGKGRLGRVWVSEPGMDLTFSLLLRPDVPPELTSRFTLATSTAVADAVSALEGLEGRVTIKWPNDVLVDGRKVCGILAEASLDMDRLHWLVVGIGLNVNGSPGDRVPAADLPAGAPAPTSLRDRLQHDVLRARLLVSLLERLEVSWSELTGEGWLDVRRRFHEHDALFGKPVEVHTSGRAESPPLVGIARGLSSAGELLVEDTGGAVSTVVSGDVSLRRRQP